jgi:hypothetical protein
MILKWNKLIAMVSLESSGHVSAAIGELLPMTAFGHQEPAGTLKCLPET